MLLNALINILFYYTPKYSNNHDQNLFESFVAFTSPTDVSIKAVIKYLHPSALTADLFSYSFDLLKSNMEEMYGD